MLDIDGLSVLFFSLGDTDSYSVRNLICVTLLQSFFLQFWGCFGRDEAISSFMVP